MPFPIKKKIGGFPPKKKYTSVVRSQVHLGIVRTRAPGVAGYQNEPALPLGFAIILFFALVSSMQIILKSRVLPNRVHVEDCPSRTRPRRVVACVRLQ